MQGVEQTMLHSNFIDQLAASALRGEQWRVDGKEVGGEATSASNSFGDYTGRHSEEGVALEAPA